MAIGQSPVGVAGVEPVEHGAERVVSVEHRVAGVEPVEHGVERVVSVEHRVAGVERVEHGAERVEHGAERVEHLFGARPGPSTRPAV